ncbi:MAG TPA: GDP-mannose pyrophosphatase NudK [Cytophagales bacterium]|nr:GDP-mannose pyrophosphatase NudK [Cytophagales bacterium]
MEDGIRILSEETLSKQKYHLKKLTFELIRKTGEVQKQVREVYDRGNGATILLYNSDSRNIILTKQFRLPTYLNGNKSGLLIETCAGLLDEHEPEECIRKEVEEETGFEVKNVKKIFKAYMSPGAVTEILHFFIGSYFPNLKTGEGGGLKEEGEDIEVIELPFDEAYKMIKKEEITDAKTILLLQYAMINNLFR